MSYRLLRLSYLKFYLLIMSSSVFATDLTSCWKSTNFLADKHIDFIMGYKQDIYAVGGNAQNQGEGWRYTNGKWKTIYKAGDDSVISNAILYGDDLYVSGNSAESGGWLIQYFPDGESRIDLKVKFAEQITALDRYHEQIVVGGSNLHGQGAIWLYSPLNKKWKTISPSGFKVINAVLVERNGLIYAAGINSKTQKANVVRYVNGKWQDTGLPTGVVNVDELVVDKYNTIYASGLDEDYHAYIWKFIANKWIMSKLGIQQAINSMQLADDGTIYVAGKDEAFRGQVWHYDAKLWTKMNFPLADSATSLAFNSHHQLFASGVDKQNNSQVWMCDLTESAK